MGRYLLIAVVTAIGFSPTARAEDVTAPPSRANAVTLSPAELFGFADQALSTGDFATAETAYRALTTNPDLELRSEARFRLGMMLADQMGKHREAAVEFRKIDLPH